MFNNEMLEKLQRMKTEAENSKLRLEKEIIEEVSTNGVVRIQMRGNRTIQSIEITSNHANLDREELEDLLLITFNRALEKVDQLNEKEVMTSAQSFFNTEG